MLWQTIDSCYMCTRPIDTLAAACTTYRRLKKDMSEKSAELEARHKDLLQFQTNAVLDAGTPPSRTLYVMCRSYRMCASDPCIAASYNPYTMH